VKSDRWRLVSPHLDQVLELAEEERQRYLRDLASEDPALAADLELLLGEERALHDEKYLEHDPQDLLAESPLAGQVFGTYSLIEPLGAGGMGSVWLARRSDGRFEGTAAVKLLSAALLGAEGVARFRREGTILARLKHPHIAQLIDAGVSEAGQPYLVLEYVEGEPIDRWCDHQALDVPSRLRLFLDVLAAMAYAHSHLVIHRDLKPSNVMVSTEGRVKLLDFGIAKLLEGDTEDGPPTAVTLTAGRAFTPAFAAPEQILGERATTATDVYSLGALLYLLLAGRHPAGPPGTSPVALLRAILESEPERPSDVVYHPRARSTEALAATAVIAAGRASTPERLRRELRGDLDTIVAKALKKRPEERYASVTALAEDLRRYLAEEPIQARPDSLAYRAGKFARRNARGLVAAAAAVLALVAVVAFYGTRLADERDRQLRAAQKAAQVSDFLTSLLTNADPFEATDREPTVRSLLDRGASRVQKDLAKQPELQAEMLTLLGRIYQRRGAYEQALPLLQQAVVLGRKTRGPSRELAQSLNDLGVAQRQKAGWATARATLEEALAMRQKVLGREHPEVAVTESELGRVLFDQGHLGEAETHFRSALAIRRKALGPADHETATSMSDLGLLLRDKGDRAGAEALLRETLVVTRKTRGPQHPDVATALANLALTVNESGNPKAAEAMFREALAIGQASLGKDHPGNAQRLANLAGTLRLLGKLAEAEARSEEALALSRPALGRDHPAVARQEVTLARVYLDQGRPDAARSLLQHVLAVQEKSYAAGDWRLGTTESLLGMAYTKLSRFAEAEPHLLRAAELLPVTPGSDGPKDREARANRERLVALYEAWGRPEKAAPYRSR
jgi:eukaryotic-like serine/threonine-protein kinase